MLPLARSLLHTDLSANALSCRWDRLTSKSTDRGSESSAIFVSNVKVNNQQRIINECLSFLAQSTALHSAGLAQSAWHGILSTITRVNMNILLCSHTIHCMLYSDSSCCYWTRRKWEGPQLSKKLETRRHAIQSNQGSDQAKLFFTVEIGSLKQH